MCSLAVTCSSSFMMQCGLLIMAVVDKRTVSDSALSAFS